MDALVMCGGRGTRLESSREKPLYPIGGVPMVDRVVSALEKASIGAVYAAVSPNAPVTADRLERRSDVRTIETPGEGYVADLGAALAAIDRPALTVAADLPLLEAAVVDRVLAVHGDAATAGGRSAPSLSVAVPAALKRRLGASVDATLEPPHLVPTGLNVVGDPEDRSMHVSYDARLAINVNRETDARAAERLLATRDRDEGPPGESRCG